MDPTQNLYLKNPFFLDRNAFLSKISDVFESCNRSKNQMIGIYLLEEKRFLYFNQVFKSIFEGCEDTLREKGWSEWFALIDAKEAKGVKKRVVDFLTVQSMKEPFAHKYHVTNYSGKKFLIHHEILLQQFGKCPLAVNFFTEVRNKTQFSRLYRPNKAIGTKEPSVNISAREKEVLHFIADGFSSKQIASILYISTHTAISHRKRLIEKFKVRNTAQLIKKASKIIEL